MSQNCFYGQLPRDQTHIECRDQEDQFQYNTQLYYQYQQRNCSISFVETPTPGQYDEIMNSDNYAQQIEINNYKNDESLFMQYPQQLQTLPYVECIQIPNNTQLEPLQYRYFQTFNCQQVQKQDQNIFKDMDDDFNDIQKNSDQSTDAQVQSEQDNNFQLKEKVKQPEQSEKLQKLIQNHQEGKFVPESELEKLDDIERAIFCSLKNAMPSLYNMNTPEPNVNEQQNREDLTLQNQFPDDISSFNDQLEGNQNQILSSQLSNEISDQSQQDSSIFVEPPSNNKKLAIQKKQKKGIVKISNSSHGNQQNKKKVKRVEEQYKMVFKKAWKFVETSYFRERIKKSRISSKDKDYKKFYEFYFNQASLENKIPLKNFYHPQKQLNFKFNKQKQLIFQYYLLIKFQNVFLEMKKFIYLIFQDHQFNQQRYKILLNRLNKYIQD